MIADIGAGIVSLKAAFDLAKGLNTLRNAAEINDVKMTLQAHILEAQQSLFAAQEAQSATAKRIAELEAEIMRFKKWSSERESYELVNVSSGALAYMLKAGMRGSEPPHWLCANCFERGEKGVLQMQPRKKDDQHHAIFACPVCKNSLATPLGAHPRWRD